MAPRSYLARIAQPLAVGDPVVWSVPRAPADEARPLATGPAAERFSPPPRPGAARHGPARPKVPPSIDGPNRDGPAMDVDADSAPARPAEPGRPTASAAGPVIVSVKGAAPSSPPRAPAGPPPNARLAPPNADVSRLSPLETAPASRHDRPPPPLAEAARPRLHIGTIEVRANPLSPAVAPRTIPAPAAAAPRPPVAGRIGRAYAWRFGLAQG